MEAPMDVATGGVAEEESSRKRGLEVGEEEEEDDAATIELGKRLLAACKAGEEESVKKLLEEDKAPAYYQDPSDGMSCLMGAAQGGHEAIVGALLGAGAPWNALDRKGRCAGEYAMESGAQGCIDRLVDHAVMAELILGAAGEGVAAVQEESDRYLKGKVRYEGEDRLVDEEDLGVMMEWEAPLMQAHAQLLCGEGGREVLNVGFGMGIIDRAIQSLGCRSHTIIEAHPDVADKARQEGWGKEGSNVTLCEGKWQDVIPQLIAEGRRFDAIFFDTYAEHYTHMQVWHAFLPSLLREGGLYSFFNGLAPDNPFFHAVACQMVKLELEQLGFDVDFLTCQVEGGASDEEVWAGLRRRYWHGREEYYLPHAILTRPSMDSQSQSEEEEGEGEVGEGASADDILVGLATLADGESVKEVLLRPCLDSVNGGLQWLPVGEVDRRHPLALGPLRTWFPPMLLDEKRNGFFQRLVGEAVQRAGREGGEGGVRVLDVGTGTGLLALMAARAGATDVTAVEGNPALASVAESVIAGSPFGDKVGVVEGRSQEMSVEDMRGGQKADVLVAELLDSSLLGEGYLPALRDAKARGLVREGAVIAPQRARVWGRLVCCPMLRDLHVIEGEGEVGECVKRGRGALLPLHTEALEDLVYVSEPFLLLDLDFDQVSEGEARVHKGRTVNVKLGQGAEKGVHGVVVGWDLPFSSSSSAEGDVEGGKPSSSSSSSSGEMNAVGGAEDVYTTVPWAEGRVWQDHWRPCVWALPTLTFGDGPPSTSTSTSTGGSAIGEVRVRAAHDDHCIWLAVTPAVSSTVASTVSSSSAASDVKTEEVEIGEEPVACVCGRHQLPGQSETGLPVERFLALNHAPTNAALTNALTNALAGLAEGAVVLDVSGGGRCALLASSLAPHVTVVSLQGQSLHAALLAKSASARGLANLHVWRGAQAGEGWAWGEESVGLIIGDGYFQRVGVNRPIWGVLNFWFLRTALAPVCRRDVGVLPFRARVMVALVEFQDLQTAHGLAIPDVAGFDHSAIRKGVEVAESMTFSDEDGDLGVWANVEHRHRLLTRPTLLMSLDVNQEVNFAQAEASMGVYRRGRVRSPVVEEGEAHGVLIWVDLDLDYEAAVSGEEGRVVSGYGPGLGMRQSVRWLKERRGVGRGQVLEARGEVNVINPEVRMRFEVKGEGEEGEEERE